MIGTRLYGFAPTIKSNSFSIVQNRIPKILLSIHLQRIRKPHKARQHSIWCDGPLCQLLRDGKCVERDPVRINYLTADVECDWVADAVPLGVVRHAGEDPGPPPPHALQWHNRRDNIVLLLNKYRSVQELRSSSTLFKYF